MKRTIWLSMTAMLLSSAAIAQTATNPPTTLPPASPAPSTAPMTTPAAPGAINPPPAGAASAPATTGTVRQDANAPLPGANSFTEAQARSRIEGSGFTGLTGLTKDEQGIWRGTAMKDGKSVTVSLDFRGNVVGQ